MNTAPVILAGPLADVLPAIETASVDAVIALVPVHSVTPRPSGSHTMCIPIQPEDLDNIVPHLRRISRGPIALLLIEQAEAWAEAFTRHGLAVSKATYDNDLLDVVVAYESGQPVPLPPASTPPVRPLVKAILDSLTKPGDVVLTPFAEVPLVALTVQATGRQLLAVSPATTYARLLTNEINRDGSGISLTKEEQQSVLARAAAGEKPSRIARSLGISDGAIFELVRRRAA